MQQSTAQSNVQTESGEWFQLENLVGGVILRENLWRLILFSEVFMTVAVCSFLVKIFV